MGRYDYPLDLVLVMSRGQPSLLSAIFLSSSWSGFARLRGWRNHSIREIEAVIFSAVPEDERIWCDKFAELRDFLLGAPLQSRRAKRGAIQQKTLAIAHENQVWSERPTIQAKIEELQRTIRGLETELKALPEMAAEPIVVQHSANIR